MSQRRRAGRTGRSPGSTQRTAAEAPATTRDPSAGTPGRRAPARPEPAKKPIGLIIGGLLVVVAIVVGAMMFSSGDDGGSGGSNSRSKESPPNKVAEQPSGGGGETANGAEPDAPSGSGTPAGGSESSDDELDDELDVDKAAELAAEYKRRTLLAESKDDKIELAKWCQKNGLKKEAKEIAEPLLVKYPDDGALNRIVGNRRFEGEHPDFYGKWLTKTAYKAAMQEEQAYAKKLKSDPQFQKMHETARSLSAGYLKNFNVFSIMEWPYVIMIEDFGTSNRNEHYGSVNRSRVRAFYNYMKKSYPKLFTKEPDFPFRVIVLKDQASFNKFNEQLAGGARDPSVRAYFNTVTKFVYTYEKDERGSKLAREFSLGVLFHECTHQLLDFLRPKNHIAESMWFEEALAEYHGGVRITGRDEEDLLTYSFGHVNNVRLRAIKAAMRSKRIFDLHTLFGCKSYQDADASFARKFGVRSIGRGKSLLYCQGWSFIHFCLEGPNKKYRAAMLDYINRDVADGDGEYRSMRKAFGIAKKEQWEPIEREWKVFAQKLKDPEK